MMDGSETNSDDSPTHLPTSGPHDHPIRRPEPGDRTWSHPSEVGLAVRGSSDRRRSSIIAAGVVVSGLGLLLSGVLMGTAEDPRTVAATSAPTYRLEHSVAAVEVRYDGDTSVLTGFVLDETGHVVVPTRIAGGAEIRVTCGETSSVPATLVAEDRRSGIAVLLTEVPKGTPVTPARPPLPGAEVIVARSTAEGSTTTRGRIGHEVGVAGSAWEPPIPQLFGISEPRGVAFVADNPGAVTDGLVFDRSGRLVGATATGSFASTATVILPAEELVAAALDLLGPPD
jgi:S1-C subfamily serine protease